MCLASLLHISFPFLGQPKCYLYHAEQPATLSSGEKRILASDFSVYIKIALAPEHSQMCSSADEVLHVPVRNFLRKYMISKSGPGRATCKSVKMRK